MDTYKTDTQQALILKEVQIPLVLGRRPIPEPNRNEVLVRIIAAGSMIR
jgi:D-arabinose 1-dehydrogenase-like Zn-dependent alcohol dehydrogenase